MAMLNEKIAFLRKQNGLTQEEVANKLGVTNQAVSKWELSQSCPDIELLPKLAHIFNVSVDKLLGNEKKTDFEELISTIRSFFANLPNNEAFFYSYRIASILHETAITDGYKKYLPWKEGRSYSIEDIKSLGTSVCSDSEGSAVMTNECVFFSLGKAYVPVSSAEIRETAIILDKLSDRTVLKVMFTLYGLCVGDLDVFVSEEDIARAANLSALDVNNALNKLPLTVKEEDGKMRYRLKGSIDHIPPLITLLNI